MKIIICFLILLSFRYTFASTPIPKIDSTDVPGGKITRTEYYDGNSLWGYIDGGADLYLEYGFTGLQVQIIEWNGDRFTINVYQMKDSKSAFGIFSIQKFNCSYSDSNNYTKCVNPYQIQILYNDLYISIVNSSGSSDAQNKSEIISGIITRNFHQKEIIKFPELFTRGPFHASISDLKYFNGILGIQNGASEWIDKFENYKNFSIYYLPVDEPDGNTILARINFTNTDEFNSFLNQFGLKDITLKNGKLYDEVKDGRSLILWLSRNRDIIYFDSSLPREKVEEYIKEIERFI